ncbi:RodZ family helix-turn-helix domain-containing protein [Polynucleobacter sp. AP-Kaivos-20-H2]|jgi:transcriptional regulator with XRE-family HTH domain|uniref:helix-turn-helix domain-containing protein n=1 Tax=Polynucleobacter sp. AP-Kaivos-20-H2 TaxID=2689104 RepID=UPI001C0B8C61|nr:helix-turn-helix transcriptional regulator [Polynucleobacter sp. AP-Kaivos-20-H2]MBU3603233.1 helix-turn-helix transcriptional regulator [Polynucleobacter sp. AP-Kaivos-20-H2]
MKNHSSIAYILGENFKKAREAKEISIEDLAREVTLSKTHIEQIENGQSNAFYSESIKMVAAKKIALALGLSEEEAFLIKQQALDLQIMPETPQAPVKELLTPKPVTSERLEQKELVEKSPKPITSKNKENSAAKIVRKISILIKEKIASYQTVFPIQAALSLGVILGVAILVILFKPQPDGSEARLTISAEPLIEAKDAQEPINKAQDNPEIVKENAPVVAPPER